MDFVKNNMVGLIAMIIAVLGVFLPQVSLNTGAVSPNDGDATNYTKVTASQGLAVGTSQQFQVDSSGIITNAASAAIGTTTSQASKFVADGSGTTTLALFTSATATCVQMVNDDKAAVRATVNGTSWVLAVGKCE